MCYLRLVVVIARLQLKGLYTIVFPYRQVFRMFLIRILNRTGFLGDLIAWEDGVYGTSKSVFSGSARTCRPDGRGAPGGPRLRVGGAAVGGAEARLHGGDAAKGVRQAQRDAGHRPGLTTSERERLKELERKVRELKRANEILRKAFAYFAQAELDRRRT